MGSYHKQLESIELAQKKLELKKLRTMEKAFKSDSPDDMLKAQEAYNSLQPKPQNNSKAFFIDPLEFNANLGYKDKPFSLTYTTLRRMAKTPIINSIIKTRKNQVADFAEPQENKYSTGFVIRRKSKDGETEVKMDKQDKKIANSIREFLLKGGGEGNWLGDDFDTFIRKIVDDSLTFDQMTFECNRNRRGQLVSFKATDAATMRISDSYFAEDYKNDFFERNGSGIWQARQDFGSKINGYYPSYAQVYQNTKVNEFYPWEMCFGIRNPSTSIFANGYGCSEIEELINVITSLLWGDEYNRRFFSQGSAPKGLLRFKGNVNETALQQFKQQWQAMITGVMQSWKTPVVEGDVDWIDLQKNNRDMEYTGWMEYLIKLACAIFNIDPVEIGWDISRSSGGGGMFEGSQKERLQNSKDKGLYPLLKFIQRKLNKYIIEQIHPDFEFVFMGLNGMTIEQELEMDIKKTNSFQTINETRNKYNMKPLENGDIPSNSVFVQNANAQKMQQNQMDSEGGSPNNPQNEEKEDGKNPFDLYAEEEGEEKDKAESEDDNSFVKAFDSFMENELK